MKCPACERTLASVSVGQIVVDACKGGCGGIWFDNFELAKFDEEHETAGRALLEIPVDPDVKVDHERRRDCPKCAGVVMMRHFFSPKKAVEVDRCQACNGYWLDPGELAAIRAEYRSEVERQQAMDDYFSDVFESGMAAARAQNEAETAGLRQFALALRFICPSYYIPGKQSWGAF